MAANGAEVELRSKIEAQGEYVRTLKSESDTPQAQLNEAIELLKSLKTEYKTVVGKDFQAPGGRQQKEKKPAAPAAKKPEKQAKKQQQQPAAAADGKKQTRLGIETPKDVNYSDWYSQVITKAEMIEYYDVSGVGGAQ